MIKLGDRAKDSVTSFEGIVVARTTWLHGCDRLTIQPEKLSKDGKPQDNQTFDEKQLILVKKAAVPTEENTPSLKRTGGPRNDKSALRNNKI